MTVVINYSHSLSLDQVEDHDCEVVLQNKSASLGDLGPVLIPATQQRNLYLSLSPHPLPL